MTDKINQTPTAWATRVDTPDNTPLNDVAVNGVAKRELPAPAPKAPSLFSRVASWFTRSAPSAAPKENAEEAAPTFASQAPEEITTEEEASFESITELPKELPLDLSAKNFGLYYRINHIKKCGPFNAAMRLLAHPLYTAGTLTRLAFPSYFSQLPADFSGFQGVTSLDLSRNELITLPNGVETLQGLTELNLSGNNLRTLPESFGNLTNLTTLNLSGNPLQTIPESFAKLTKLKTIYIDLGWRRLYYDRELETDPVIKQIKAALPKVQIENTNGPS